MRTPAAPAGRGAAQVFQQGIDLFNRGEFYACHESLEQIWMTARQPERWFLQALIHFAVGFYHHRRDNRTGAVRQLRKGLKKIRGYLPQWGGVATGELEREVSERLRVIAGGGTVRAFPRIGQTAPWPGLGAPAKPTQAERPADPNQLSA